MQKNLWKKSSLAVAPNAVIKHNYMNITEATDERREEIINLLKSQKLPVEDLPARLQDFYTAIEDDKVIGLIGMESYDEYGLLRSMVVHPDYRNRRIAENLVQILERKAALSGIISMFLLTETAEKYFSRKGYHTTGRDKVPDKVKQSTEFGHVCPQSAVAMSKSLTAVTL